MDMMLVMLLPLLLRSILPVITQWVNDIWSMDRGAKTKEYERVIEHKKNYECERGIRRLGCLFLHDCHAPSPPVKTPKQFD